MKLLNRKLKKENCFWMRLTFCITMTIIVFLWYSVMVDWVINVREEKKYNKEFYSGNEFVKTIDCARIIDDYEMGTKYLLEFELKAELPGVIQVHFQNGSNTRYSYEKNVQATTQYERYSIVVEPVLNDENESESYLSFYGIYGSGVIPTIRRISFVPIEE